MKRSSAVLLMCLLVLSWPSPAAQKNTGYRPGGSFSDDSYGVILSNSYAEDIRYSSGEFGKISFKLTKTCRAGQCSYMILISDYGYEKRDGVRFKAGEPLVLIFNGGDRQELKPTRNPKYSASEQKADHQIVFGEDISYGLTAEQFNKFSDAKSIKCLLNGDKHNVDAKFDGDQLYNFAKFCRDTVTMKKPAFYVEESGDKFEGRHLLRMPCVLKRADGKSAFNLEKVTSGNSSEYSFAFDGPAANEAILLVDGNAKIVLPGRADGGRSVFVIPLAQLGSLSRANTLEMRIKTAGGNIEGELSPLTVLNIHNFYESFAEKTREHDAPPGVKP